MRRRRALKEATDVVDGKRWRWWDAFASAGDVEVDCCVIGIGPGSENRGGRSIERAWEIDSTFGRVIGERG
jgi:hypothetical protein